MKKLLAHSLLGSFLLLSNNPLKADYDAFGVDYSGDPSIGNRVYGVDSTTGEKTLLTSKVFDNNGWTPSESFMSSGTGELMIRGAGDNFHAYNWKTNTWRDIKDNSNFQKYFHKPTSSAIDEDGDTIQIGKDVNDVDITPEGLSIDGDPLISKKANGELHIGKNSWITKEENGKQNVYAKDADGNAIPINYTNGTDLQINGKSVQGQIDTNASNIKNLGEGVASSTALSAALTALPQTSKESKISCGVGTSAYSSKYALGFGCASKLNERVDINAGGSYVFDNSKSYGSGTLDSGIVKAGFVFKLGEINKSTQISMKEKENFETKIKTLEEKNNELLARLERIEKVALRDLKSKDLVIYPLK